MLFQVLQKHPKQEVCVCKSAITGKSYNFCYRDPQNLNSIGKKFNCSLLSTLEDLGEHGAIYHIFYHKLLEA